MTLSTPVKLCDERTSERDDNVSERSIYEEFCELAGNIVLEWSVLVMYMPTPGDVDVLAANEFAAKT